MPEPRRLQQLHGSVLASNTTMLQMCRELGFVVEAEPGDAGSTPVVFAEFEPGFKPVGLSGVPRMKAMILEPRGSSSIADIPDPVPGAGQVLVKVAACGVCRTDLHVVDGDLTEPQLPIIPGHEIVGRIEAIGAGVTNFQRGDRVGIPWLGIPVAAASIAGRQENFCDAPMFTGYQIDGGYAEFTVAEAAYCFPLPADYADAVRRAAVVCGVDRPSRAAHDGRCQGAWYLWLWCSRAYRRPGCAVRAAIGVRFHSAREIPSSDVRPHLGCVWAGGSDEHPGTTMDAAIIFAPVGNLVPRALEAVRKGGTVVLGGIHMSEIPAMPYRLLWGERTVRSVANLTRRDAQEFLAIAGRTRIKTEIVPYALSDANTALRHLREGQLTGAAVLVPEHST